jgi:hypothetical protein
LNFLCFPFPRINCFSVLTGNRNVQGDEAAAPHATVSPLAEDTVPDYLAEGSLGSMEQSVAFSALESESKARAAVFTPARCAFFVLLVHQCR